MDQIKIKSNWPNALRWFLVQNLESFTPWHFLENEGDFEFAANAFQRESLGNSRIFVFARRQDNDQFAGLEIVDGNITDKVIVFHPSFSTSSNEKHWDIVNQVFGDVFDFVSEQVIPDMKMWALTEDASEI